MKIAKNDNGFVCANCHKQVEKLGYTSRNHCPYCLHSLHVDVFPGDRQNACKGILVPIAIEISAKKGYVVVHRCALCGQIKRNVCAADDSQAVILTVMSKGH